MLGALEVGNRGASNARWASSDTWKSVSTSDALREAYDEVKPAVSAFYSSIPLNEGLWKRVAALADSDAGRSLEGTRARHLSKTVDDFKRHGADLDPAGKERLAAIDVHLTKLTTKYGQNVLDATNAFELIIDDEATLAGLPPSAVAAAKQNAEAKGKTGYRFTLQAPSLIPLLTYLDDGAVREHVWKAYNTSGAAGEYDNEPLVRQILELRRERAVLLGYAHFADLVLEDRMAGLGEKARSFVEELRERTRPFFERENTALADYRRGVMGDDGPPMQPWGRRLLGREAEARALRLRPGGAPAIFFGGRCPKRALRDRSATVRRIDRGDRRHARLARLGAHLPLHRRRG